VVLTRRTEHRLAKARARAHIVEGLLTALDHLDEVIALIRGSESAATAKQGLMERFELSELQAQAVLDMQLRRLAALERAALEDEYQQLQERIAGLEEILGDREVLDRVLTEELTEIKRVHATPRRSRIVADGIDTDDVLAGGSAAGFEAQDVTVMVTAGGYIKPLARRRTTPSHKHAHDPLVAVIRTTTDDTLLLVGADGTGYRVGVADLPVVRANQRGTHVGGLLGGGPDGKLAGAVGRTRMRSAARTLENRCETRTTVRPASQPADLLEDLVLAARVEAAVGSSRMSMARRGSRPARTRRAATARSTGRCPPRRTARARSGTRWATAQEPVRARALGGLADPLVVDPVGSG
jgi:DNA gyrase/topoisomerase IV subunit A